LSKVVLIKHNNSVWLAFLSYFLAFVVCCLWPVLGCFGS